MAHQQSTIIVSNHPFLEFSEYPNLGNKAYGLVGRTILHGRCVDPAAIEHLGITNEFERMLNVLPYRWVFTLTELCYMEIITKFMPLSNSTVHM